jgi:hypothetical protein
MILRYDSTFVPITIHDLEKKISAQMEINYENKTVNIYTGGILDRIDIVEGQYRVIDYKTGRTSMEIDSIDALFDEDNDDRNAAWFQILMYCEMFAKEKKEVRIRPSLYAVRNLPDIDFSDKLILKKHNDAKLIVNDYSEISNEFIDNLKGTLNKVFSKKEPFKMTSHLRKCENCLYRQMCQR